MPNPVSSLAPQIPADPYDFENAQCAVPDAKQTAHRASSECCNPQVSELVSGYRPELPAAQPEHDCRIEIAKAGLQCAQGALLVLETAPTVVGAVLAGLITGGSCGLAITDAWACMHDRKPSAR